MVYIHIYIIKLFLNMQKYSYNENTHIIYNIIINNIIYTIHSTSHVVHISQIKYI